MLPAAAVGKLMLLVYRNKGAVSGQHYHKGSSANKNPEDMLLVQGSLMLQWKESLSGAAARTGSFNK